MKTLVEILNQIELHVTLGQVGDGQSKTVSLLIFGTGTYHYISGGGGLEFCLAILFISQGKWKALFFFTPYILGCIVLSCLVTINLFHPFFQHKYLFPKNPWFRIQALGVA